MNKKRIFVFRLKDELMLYLRAAFNLGIFFEEVREKHEALNVPLLCGHYSHVTLSMLLNNFFFFYILILFG